MEKILLYTKNEKKAGQIRALCSSMKISVQMIRNPEIGCSLGSVISGKPVKKVSVPAMYFQPEILVMSGFSGDKMEKFLDAFGENQIEKIALKAMITPFNLSWSVYELTQELMKEHSTLNK